MSQISFMFALVFILFDKTGNFKCISATFFSRFYQTKTKMFKKNLRHSSLYRDLNFRSDRFQWSKQIIR